MGEWMSEWVMGGEVGGLGDGQMETSSSEPGGPLCQRTRTVSMKVETLGPWPHPVSQQSAVPIAF